MKIIEFNGLPGCGKTTISKALFSSMLRQGIFPVYYNDIHLKFPSKIRERVTHIFKHWNFREIQCLHRISRCFKKIPFREKWMRVLYAEQIASNYRAFQSEEKICIADQGLVQAVISIGYTHDFKSAASKNDFVKFSSEFLGPYFDQVIIVNTQVAPRESLKRLRSREKNYGRFDSIASDSVLLSSLQKQEELFQFLRDGCLVNKNVIYLNSSDSPVENVVRIVEYVTEKDC